MNATGTKRQPEPAQSKHPVPQIYTLEATGLLVVGVLILILTVVRYWHNIAWSAR